ncbi:MAG TPA: nitrile hydratase subunit beta [Rhodopila sp.]|jgi:nitrile hydratase|nr:nitrile hydratase subunit beta [Rhodopila sp.]
MNGIHDMGGLHGFGRVVPELNEPVFHARWEGRVFAMTQLLDKTGIYNLDEHRHEIELMEPPDYLRDGYYGRWLFAMESILHRKRILLRAELQTRLAEIAPDVEKRTPPSKSDRHWPLSPTEKILWGAWRREAKITPRFAVGAEVRVRNWQPPGHTRLPAYLRGKHGEVAMVNAQAWVWPDTRAHNRGENLQAVYNVSFAGREVWGEDADPEMLLAVDLSEAYLDPVE